ncbi:Jerky -like [Araneus ventricosus]|uniref:Jerky-like n=1 Tax=Araneus ventricosus TaxID=182803 RepID=A0A4Y2H949_ARAVE|nr:Jerky -like [Araneus ventricosus]
MTESDEGFASSKRWLDRFKHRHGIRRLKITGEKLSSNESAIEPFRIELSVRKICVLNSFTMLTNQGECWRMLPDKTLADHNEKVAPGRKAIKARITFMPCTNATGKHKLPLFVVGKAKKTQSLQVSHATCVLSRAEKRLGHSRIILGLV